MHSLRQVLAAVLIVPPLLLLGTAATAQEGANLVRNATFEEDADGDGIPDGWSTSGRQEVVQKLTLVEGRAGGKAARLECSEYVGGTPSAHAMVCQVGAIAVKRGSWYKLSFWTKGTGIQRSLCEARLSKTEPWGSSGIEARFAVTPAWKYVEEVCQATDDVPTAHSRLQFWYSSTGTLWLDDVVLEPVQVRVEFHPRISVENVRNAIPNSSFECGPGGWGSYAPGLTSWAGNVNRLVGEIDETTAHHGRRSLRIHLDKATAPVFHWDYFDPVVQPVHTLLSAHLGWVPLEPKKSHVLSCYLRADRPGTPVVGVLQQSSHGRLTQRATAGTEWQRHSFIFTPAAEYGWAGVGLDLEGSEIDAATLWVDSVQLERAETPSAYTPRSTAESTVTTPGLGNVFTDPAQGMTVNVCLWNGSDQQRNMGGHLVYRDFFDRVRARKEVQCNVPPNTGVTVPVTGILAGSRGFFRVDWVPEGHSAAFRQSVRCALVDPYPHADSPFGMNHAYPWGFMLDLCKTGGLTWMRDWSAKWHTVEPEQGAFDFSLVDPQIDRVLDSKLNPLMLLPFPSAPWCSAADMDAIRKHAEGKAYLERRYVVACPARDPALFRNYVHTTVERYRSRIRHYEIMNEPLYTTYAVPLRFGYTMDDYLTILRDAHATIKMAQPGAMVIGGIGTWAGREWTHKFIDAGGLAWCDALGIHLYPATIPPELYEEELSECRRKMASRGEGKPIWLTEFGCYADDDPYRTPHTIGDSAMSRANWPSEREAAEALVKTAAVFLTHGVTRIFYHAGTCGPVNGRNGGGIFFEYGGAPRKMYAAVNALANVLGPAPVPLLPRTNSKDILSYMFTTSGGGVAVVWARGEEAEIGRLPAGVTATDMMGNHLDRDDLRLASTPVFLKAARAEELSVLLTSPR